MMENRFSFTKTLLQKLPLPARGKRAYYHDTKVKGLSLAVTANGTLSFVVYRKIQGRPERILLGHYPVLDIEDARRLALETQAAIARGEHPGDARRRTRQEPSFAEFFEEYLALHAKPRKKTWAEDAAQFRRYLQPLVNCKLSAIRQNDIHGLHVAVGAEHGQYAANRMLALLKTVFTQACNWGRVAANPADGVAPFREKSRERFLQPQEFPKLFQALADEPDDGLRDYVLLSLFTGARRANMLAMRWREIDFQAASWHIPDTKNGTAHLIALAPSALALLQQRRQRVLGEFVFPARSATGHKINPQKGWQRILARAGIEDLRLHDLRRSLGSWQAATGANLAVIGKSLNHKDMKSTQVYARLNLEPVRQSVETAIDAMLAAAGLPGANLLLPPSTDSRGEEAI